MVIPNTVTKITWHLTGLLGNTMHICTENKANSKGKKMCDLISWNYFNIVCVHLLVCCL